MRHYAATAYEPGEFSPLGPTLTKEYVHRCLDKVRDGEPYFYEREGSTLVIAVRLHGAIHWFDCVMRSWGSERET